MPGGGRRADHQLVGDLPVGEPPGDQPHDLVLTRGKRGGATMRTDGVQPDRVGPGGLSGRRGSRHRLVLVRAEREADGVIGDDRMAAQPVQAAGAVRPDAADGNPQLRGDVHV